MNSKALILLVLAVLCGLGAMLGTNRMLSKQKSKPVYEMQDVLVAARDLKMEEVIRPEMVKLTQMPKANVSPGTFTSIKDVEDRWVQIKMLEGEAILDRKLAPKGSPAGMVARIPKGMRAYAIEVNEHTGVSGFILPDHRVDVVQAQSQNHNDNSKTEAETILQDVLVLASGQVFTRPEDRSIQSRTVTLAVTPDQVDILVAAHAKGALTLTLRGINDHDERPKKKKVEPKPEPKPEPVVALAKTPELPPPPPPPPPPPLVQQQAAAQHLTIYHGFKNPEKIRLDQPNPDDEPSPGAFAGAKSEFVPPAN